MRQGCLADHPRSRGVYMSATVRRMRGVGSSPLARGLPGRGVEPPGIHGIIPARAGFTARTAPTRWPRADHPRSRGVYAEEICILCGGWIIPARAGFTRLEAESTDAHPDHPRSRGVYTG